MNDSNVGYDKLRFNFDGETDNSGGETTIKESLGIVSESEVKQDGETFILTPESRLEPGDEVAFGISVDLLPSGDREPPDLSGGVDIDLKITTGSEVDS